jgi:hypothetical protein
MHGMHGMYVCMHGMHGMYVCMYAYVRFTTDCLLLLHERYYSNNLSTYALLQTTTYSQTCSKCVIKRVCVQVYVFKCNVFKCT